MSNPGTFISSEGSYLQPAMMNQKVDKIGMQERAANARDLELKIIIQTLKRSKEQQIEEIDKSFKWEIETLRQELTSEAEGRIAMEICQLQKAKELRLLQQEEFARKDVELEAEKLKKKVMAQFDDEKQRMEQEHRDTLAQLRDTYEKKTIINKQKREFKNEKLFEADNAS